MSKNTVQFQKDLSLSSFTASYGTEEQCFDALFDVCFCSNTTYARVAVNVGLALEVIR